VAVFRIKCPCNSRVSLVKVTQINLSVIRLCDNQLTARYMSLRDVSRFTVNAWVVNPSNCSSSVLRQQFGKFSASTRQCPAGPAHPAAGNLPRRWRLASDLERHAGRSRSPEIVRGCASVHGVIVASAFAFDIDCKLVLESVECRRLSNRPPAGRSPWKCAGQTGIVD